MHKGFARCKANQAYTALHHGEGVWGVAPRQVAGTPVPVFTPGTDAGRVCTRALHDAKPTKHTQPFSRERGQFGRDAEIRTHQALHEAKPSECPKGDRDNKSEVYFKNRLFLQPDRRLCLRFLFVYIALNRPLKQTNFAT